MKILLWFRSDVPQLKGYFSLCETTSEKDIVVTECPQNLYIQRTGYKEQGLRCPTTLRYTLDESKVKMQLHEIELLSPIPKYMNISIISLPIIWDIISLAVPIAE